MVDEYAALRGLTSTELTEWVFEPCERSDCHLIVTRQDDPCRNTKRLVHGDSPLVLEIPLIDAARYEYLWMCVRVRQWLGLINPPKPKTERSA
jgi:hypothetical protein